MYNRRGREKGESQEYIEKEKESGGGGVGGGGEETWYRKGVRPHVGQGRSRDTG